MDRLLVKDWMQTSVITGHERMPMLEAHKLMRRHHIRRIPVVKRNGVLVGIVTRSDVREAQPSDATTLNVWEMNYLLAELTLRDIMTRDVHTVSPDDSISRAAQLMHDHQIGALPVIDDQRKVVGIITESDIFRILITWFNEQQAESAAS